MLPSGNKPYRTFGSKMGVRVTPLIPAVDHAQQLARRGEEMVGLMVPVPNHGDPVAHDAVGRRAPELSGPLTGASKLAHESSGAIKDHNSEIRLHRVAPVIEDVEVAALVKGDLLDRREQLPRLAVDGSDAEDFLEIGVDRPVLAGQCQFLGVRGRGTGQGGGRDAGKETGKRRAPAAVSPMTWT